MNTKETTVEDVLKKAYEDACKAPQMIINSDDPKSGLWMVNLNVKNMVVSPTVINFRLDAEDKNTNTYCCMLQDPASMSFEEFKEWCGGHIEDILRRNAVKGELKCIHVYDMHRGDKEPANGGKGVDISGYLLDDHQKEGLRWLVEDFEYMAKKHE